ncbi:MAG: glycosyltransferase [Endomicrobium sp.]|jgi:rhamnosyltransferase|nr:glycosyltransferase [Endomicrobium sp.]
MMTVCAVIVSYNCDKIFRCYESVKEQADFIVIVDNATSDASIIAKLQSLANTDAKLKLILSLQNLGIAWALNKGVAYAKERQCDWLLTLDQDSQLPPQTVANMLKFYSALPNEKKETAAVLGCKYIERGFLVNNMQDLTQWDAESEPFKENNLMVTSGNFVKMPVFEKTGLFEEKLFIDYVDIEFYYRVLKAGFKNYEAQNVFILHEFGNSQKKLGFHITNQPPFRRYYIARNGFYFFKEFLFIYPCRALRVLFGATLGGAAKILLFEKDKLKKFKYILRGLKDALSGKYGKL